MRLALTKWQWTLAGVLILVTALSPPPAGSFAELLGGALGTVLLVWAMVIIARAATAGWSRTSGGKRGAGSTPSLFIKVGRLYQRFLRRIGFGGRLWRRTRRRQEGRG